MERLAETINVIHDAILIALGIFGTSVCGVGDIKAFDNGHKQEHRGHTDEGATMDLDIIGWILVIALLIALWFEANGTRTAADLHHKWTAPKTRRA